MVAEGFVQSIPSACSAVPGLAAPTANVSTLACVGNGVITVTTTAAAGSVTLTLAPTYNFDEPVQWACRRTAGENKHVPSECRA
ncbi:pilin [Pseudoxanthomonas koreensis]|uniref:pilin n=1 Tax=Pseudoxanthomonas koreensis TaxID=266061 RepID=UPI0035A5FDDA